MSAKENIKKQIERLARRYDLQLVYAFGSRAREALEMMEGKTESLSRSRSDLDIGIKAAFPLNVQQKVDIAIFLEDLFDVPRVDLVVVPEAPVFLALTIVTGEILYAKDTTYEAEYQLYIMRMAAELAPYERAKQKMMLGV